MKIVSGFLHVFELGNINVVIYEHDQDPSQLIYRLTYLPYKRTNVQHFGIGKAPECVWQ